MRKVMKRGPKNDVITYSPDVPLSVLRFKAHLEVNSPLAKNIETDGTHYWITEGNPRKTSVRYKDNKSVAVSMISDRAAFGTFDEDGNQVAPSYMEMLNTNPANDQYEPVMIQMSVGQMRSRFTDPCPFDLLSDEHIALIREIIPEFVTDIDVDGNEYQREQGLVWEVLG